MKTLDEAFCLECSWSGPVPAVIPGPCGHRQIRRVCVLEQSDALARQTREEERLIRLLHEAAQVFDDIGMPDTAKTLRKAIEGDDTEFLVRDDAGRMEPI